MIEVKDVRFSEEIDPGDGVVARFDGEIGIFYTHGVVLNERYLVGEVRFIRDDGGNHQLNSLEQHDGVPGEVYGSYRRVSRGAKICSLYGASLNGFESFWHLAQLSDIICVLRGEDTFRYNQGMCFFERRLAEEFPEARFGEIGSSNVGLNSDGSDIDIFIYDGYDYVMEGLRRDLEGFGLVRDGQLFGRAVERHQTQYDLPREEAERICGLKLEGVVFGGKRVCFFDSSENPVFNWILQPNCLERVTLMGEIVDVSFSGHHVVSYDIEGDGRASVVLVRGIFKKEKRHIVDNGSLVDVVGNLIHRDPDVIITEDLRILQ